MEAKDKYEVVIGLEVHAQLLTKSKIFCGDSTEFGGMPNTNISPLTIAHPGALPKLNKMVVEYAMKMGIATQCEIARFNFFDRKNYFYPDLPKGYQITQDKEPICRKGWIKIKQKSGEYKTIGITKIHLEEDAGKSIHLNQETDTLVDLNRAGVPLIEIVSEPDMRSSDEAYQYLTEIRQLVRYLDVCDGNMEEGSLRCDANVSVRLWGEPEFGKKVEVKNMNSIRNVQRAIDHEVDRQVEIIENGGTIVSETRMFDATNGNTYSLRTKEDLNDYRYFPEPDLQPVVISDEWYNRVRAEIPALPHELLEKFISNYQLPDYDALVLTDNKEIALFFDDLCTKTHHFKAASNWVMGPVKSYLNENSVHINNFPINTETIASLIELVESNKVSNTVANQRIFPALLKDVSKTPLEIAEELNLIQESNLDVIGKAVDQILAKYPEKVEEYKKGKKGLMGLFVGEVMKLSGGKADPKATTAILQSKLEA
jgi:aspartyl-tRNA(Asn)/glutamyl-tRNA(Gln) amidotransferase subunit B